MGRHTLYGTEEEKNEAKRVAQKKYRAVQREHFKKEGKTQTNFILDSETKEFLEEIKDEIGASNLSDVLMFIIKGLKSSMMNDEEFHREYIEMAKRSSH